MTTKLPADIQPGDITVGSAYGMTNVSRALTVIPYANSQNVLIKWQSVALYTGGSEISYTFQHTYPADFELPIFSASEILKVIAPNAWLPGQTGPAFPPPPPDPYDVILAAHSDKGIPLDVTDDDPYDLARARTDVEEYER